MSVKSVVKILWAVEWYGNRLWAFNDGRTNFHDVERIRRLSVITEDFVRNCNRILWWRSAREENRCFTISSLPKKFFIVFEMGNQYLLELEESLWKFKTAFSILFKLLENHKGINLNYLFSITSKFQGFNYEIAITESYVIYLTGDLAGGRALFFIIFNHFSDATHMFKYCMGCWYGVYLGMLDLTQPWIGEERFSFVIYIIYIYIGWLPPCEGCQKQTVSVRVSPWKQCIQSRSTPGPVSCSCNYLPNRPQQEEAERSAMSDALSSAFNRKGNTA